MRYKKVVILVLTIAFIVFLQLPGVYALTNNTLKVTVRDDSFQPIAGATVTATGPVTLSGTTDEDGKVTFFHVPNGRYSIIAAATGYLQTGIATASLWSRGGTATSSVTITLVRVVLNTVPEVPFGTIVISLAMALGIVGFLGVPRLRKRL